MSPGPVRTVAAICLAGCVLLVLHALLLGFHVEDTPRALDDAAKGRAVGYPAAAGGIAALLALAGARRAWGVVALGLAVVLVLVALVTDLVR